VRRLLRRLLLLGRLLLRRRRRLLLLRLACDVDRGVRAASRHTRSVARKSGGRVQRKESLWSACATRATRHTDWRGAEATVERGRGSTASSSSALDTRSVSDTIRTVVMQQQLLLLLLYYGRSAGIGGPARREQRFGRMACREQRRLLGWTVLRALLSRHGRACSSGAATWPDGAAGAASAAWSDGASWAISPA
jgi:hypothetical protein